MAGRYPAPCPYPGEHPQDGVRLPEEGLGVEGAPSFARSIRAPFHPWGAPWHAAEPLRVSEPLRAAGRGGRGGNAAPRGLTEASGPGLAVHGRAVAPRSVAAARLEGDARSTPGQARVQGPRAPSQQQQQPLSGGNAPGQGRERASSDWEGAREG